VAAARFGVSTCWRSRSIADGERLAEAVAALGAPGVEIDYRIGAAQLPRLLAALRNLAVTPLSIHAVCPAPEGKESAHVAEAWQLDDEDEDARGAAVRGVAATLRLAGSLGARAVVVHAGMVKMDRVIHELQKLYDEGALDAPEGRRRVNELKIARHARRGRGVDQLIRSLEELEPVAREAGAWIALENRYYLRETPSFEEMAAVFARMEGSMTRYWHDSGHARAQANLGITPFEAWLETFGRLAVGVHLHDVDGYTDHQAIPAGANGGVDFGWVAGRLPEDALRIVELSDRVTEPAARATVEWLRMKGIA